MPVDSVNGIHGYQITPASGSQNQRQSQRDRSKKDEHHPSREEEKEDDTPPQKSPESGDLGQILDTSKVVELLNHRPKSPIPDGNCTRRYTNHKK